jgi:AcrR family transcriptional regulator
LQREETRQRILESANRLIAEKGFQGTRTLDVAEASDLSHGAVFLHFPTRNTLLHEVAIALGIRITDRLHDLWKNGGSFREALTAHIKALAAEEALYASLLAEPSLKLEVIGIQSAISHHLMEAAEPEMKAGKLREVPMHLLFNTWIGLVHHYLMNRELFAPKGGVLKKHGAALVDHYMSLLRR